MSIRLHIVTSTQPSDSAGKDDKNGSSNDPHASFHLAALSKQFHFENLEMVPCTRNNPLDCLHLANRLSFSRLGWVRCRQSVTPTTDLGANQASPGSRLARSEAFQRPAQIGFFSGLEKMTVRALLTSNLIIHVQSTYV